MRAVFPAGPHRGHRHSDPERVAADRSKNRAGAPRPAGRFAHALGHGRSQGASGINQAVIKSLPALQGAPLQVIHLAGARDERLVADNYQRENIPAYVSAFHHAMEEVYSAADFAIARSGAASLAELAAFALPAILIPFPYAAEDHQTRNAEIFARADAAVILKES